MTDAERVIAARSDRVFGLAVRYFRHYLRRHFHALRIVRGSRPAIGADEPAIICATHPSWWDPLVMVLLSAALFPGRRGYGPMEQAALGRYGFFPKLGIFGIDPESQAGARRFLGISNRVLDLPGGMLWVTAQGSFTDPRTRPIALRPGVAHLARRRGPGAVIPLALEYPFWNERPPEALAHFGTPLPFDPETGPAAWNERLQAALAETADQLARAARSRDPARFETLVAGRTGVGGIYDVGRRLKAWAGGRRATLAHEEQPWTQ